MQNTKFIKSPLNYTGGKYKLLKQILPLFPVSINTFVDLFCGGGDIFANVTANKIVANDLNTNVIDIYKILQNQSINEILDYIEHNISTYELTIQNTEGYNKFRENYNNGQKHPLDLFTLICYSFNHQIRFNNKGEFNMPFGKERSYFNQNIKQNLISFHNSIHEKTIAFTTNSFEALKPEKLSTCDFVYCDPPYLITCASYNEKDSWTEKEEVKLYSLLDSLNEHNIKFGLSNVFTNKGKTNDILCEWSQKYTTYHLSHSYSNCSYHGTNKEMKTDEVYITNL